MSIQYIVARYNESIDWLKSNTDDIIIYNKGEPIEFKNVVQLGNVGREGHTYLYHIIDNYDKLADITVFTQARISDHGYLEELTTLKDLAKSALETGYSSNYKIFTKFSNIHFSPDFNIQLKDILVNNHNAPVESVDKIRFDDWFKIFIESTYPDNIHTYMCGIFAVTKAQILSRPKSFYEKLLLELVNENAPIEGHFIERSWFYIFNCHKQILNKNIFILWLQGWENAPWLVRQVEESWRINNPDWVIHNIDINNLSNYVNDIDYIYDKQKNISPQAKSDIIRLSLLKNHGGIWVDATMLCMQPLNHWVFDSVESTGTWMYHGNSGEQLLFYGCASWFIVSKKNQYIISQWKSDCDTYWETHNSAHDYYWLDGLFVKLLSKDSKFKEMWNKVPFINCDVDGQPHTLVHHGFDTNTIYIKQWFLKKPPYALKFWLKLWLNIFPDENSEMCKQSNGYYAIQLSKRKYYYKHTMT